MRAEVYEEVLRLLRTIESEGVWPETSLARTSLYAGATGAARRGFKPDKQKKEEQELRDSDPTVVSLNDDGGGNGEVAEAVAVRQQTFCMGAMPADREQPAANKVALLRRLMVALADLERAVLPERPPSSTVAINKHVTYRPHKDGGAGAGQGVSLIIGMGDFSGGELVVEGKVSG